MRKHRVRTVTIIIFATFLAFVGVWQATYGDEGDPKNLKYILWKAGLYKMDLDLAAGVMAADPNHNELVIGKTEEQLRRRFRLSSDP